MDGTGGHGRPPTSAQEPSLPHLPSHLPPLRPGVSQQEQAEVEHVHALPWPSPPKQEYQLSPPPAPQQEYHLHQHYDHLQHRQQRHHVEYEFTEYRNDSAAEEMQARALEDPRHLTSLPDYPRLAQMATFAPSERNTPPHDTAYPERQQESAEHEQQPFNEQYNASYQPQPRVIPPESYYGHQYHREQVENYSDQRHEQRSEEESHQMPAHMIVPASPQSSNMMKISSLISPMSDIPTPAFPGVHCGKQFESTSVLDAHLREAQRPLRAFACPKCSASFADRGQQAHHVRTVHEKQRPHKCDQCVSAFGTRSDLRRHKAMCHEKVRPFKCDTCDSTFQMKTHLSAHVSTVHEKRKPYVCNECGLTFGLKWNRNNHVRRVHQKLTPFQCEEPYCTVSFAQKYDLQRCVLSDHARMCGIPPHHFNTRAACWIFSGFRLMIPHLSWS
jgi:hypothetical protein